MTAPAASLLGFLKAPKVAALVAGLLLAACETAVEIPEYADITFSHLPAINLNVENLETVSTFVVPAGPGHVEREFPVDLVKTAQNWGRDRLVPVGADGTVTLTVTNASVTETRLEKTDGLTGVITPDQDFRYDAVLSVTVSAADLAGGNTAQTTVTVNRSQTGPEDLSYNEREKICYEMAEKLMGDLDTRLESAVRSHMVYFLAL